MIAQKYNRMAEKVKRKTTSVITKKQLIERNYHLLEVALKIVPLPILSCEESLLSGILLANSGLFDTVKEQMAKEEKACKLACPNRFRGVRKGRRTALVGKSAGRRNPHGCPRQSLEAR